MKCAQKFHRFLEYLEFLHNVRSVYRFHTPTQIAQNDGQPADPRGRNGLGAHPDELSPRDRASACGGAGGGRVKPSEEKCPIGFAPWKEM